jgi:hypothetical protein
MPTIQDLKRAILTSLAARGVTTRPHAHKFNIIGREYQPGALEHALNVTFSSDDRALANTAFEELRRDGYIRSMLRDLSDPENWVEITSQGEEYLQGDLKDEIDERLEAIAPHLVELRRGMWDALPRTSPDAPRQAANSARELIGQLLSEGAPVELTTRKQRFRHLMQARTNGPTASDSDLDILEANAEVVEAEHRALLKSVHLRGSPTHKDVRASVEATERILHLLFGT